MGSDKESLRQNEVVYCKKPDWVSFDDIHQLLWEANETNRARGFLLKTSQMPGEKLEARMGEDGKCFVALVNNRLVGTLSVKYAVRNKWYAKGLIAEFIHIAINPQYQGRHILSGLFELGYKAAEEKNCSVIEMETADRNTHAIQVYEHYGFHKVSYKPNKGGDHYSVVMVRWKNRPPKTYVARVLLYIKRKAIVILRYNPDGTKRFAT